MADGGHYIQGFHELLVGPVAMGVAGESLTKWGFGGVTYQAIRGGAKGNQISILKAQINIGHGVR